MARTEKSVAYLPKPRNILEEHLIYTKTESRDVSVTLQVKLKVKQSNYRPGQSQMIPDFVTTLW